MSFEDTILKRGQYRDYQFIISRSGQIRCGYVFLPKNNVLAGMSYENLNSLGVKVHGGLTYSDLSEIDGVESWVIGFDCGHLGDAPDPSLPDDLPPEVKKIQEHLNLAVGIGEGNPKLFSKGVVRTEEFVVNEIKKLIDQIITLSMRGS